MGNSSVSFEQGSSANLTVEFTGECVDFTPKTIWVVESGNITINKTSETTATVSASNQTSGVIAVTMPTNARTVQTVRYNITFNPLTPPTISAVGDTTLTIPMGSTNNIEVKLTGGSSGYNADVEYTSDNSSVTVEKLTKTTAKLTGVSDGSATVTAKVIGTNNKVTYSVSVSAEIPV